jgi:hypothetical protein
MPKNVAIFWPGDARPKPNELALPNVEEATLQLEAALRKLGRTSYRVPGFLAKPHEAIEKLGPIDDPMVGVCVHWFYGPHTTDGVVGKDNPLLLTSNFSGRWPGLVGLLNTGACLESVGRAHSRAWTDAADWTKDATFMARLAEWCETGRVAYPEDELSYSAPQSPAAVKLAREVAADIHRRRVLVMMLGDTSMGMINGYFGPRLLNPHGFTEHKIDQAWIIDRGRRVEEKRIDDALRFVKDRGVTFHYREKAPGAALGADDFDEKATREQLRDYLVALDLAAEFKADCIGWQYQLGLIPLRPPSDFAEGLLNSTCRPESSGDTIVCSTEADQGNVVPMELMKRLLKRKGLHQAVMFHDVRWGAEHDGRLRDDARSGHAEGRALLAPAGAVLPHAGRHVRGREPAGAGDLGARVHQERGPLDGRRPRRGRQAPAGRARLLVGRHDARVAADGRGPRRLARRADGALPVEPCGRRVRRRLRGDGRAQPGAGVQGADRGAGDVDPSC